MNSSEEKYNKYSYVSLKINIHGQSVQVKLYIYILLT